MELDREILLEAKQLYEQVQSQLADGTFDVTSFDDMCDDDPNFRDLYYHFGRIEICVIYHVCHGTYDLCSEMAIYEQEIGKSDGVNPIEYIEYEDLIKYLEEK